MVEIGKGHRDREGGEAENVGWADDLCNWQGFLPTDSKLDLINLLPILGLVILTVVLIRIKKTIEVQGPVALQSGKNSFRHEKISFVAGCVDSRMEFGSAKLRPLCI